MKLFPPHEDVVLYEQGFGTGDLLSRKSAGQRLSELLERVEDPVVVALDGAWGSGKTHFLRRWVGAHKIENSGSATTIYFDAFSNDFLDDPLIALVSAIDERLPKNSRNGAWGRTRNAAAKLARPLFRIGAAVASAGATEVTGPVLDALIIAGGKEAEEAAEMFWKKEQGRRAAIAQFREALLQLTASEGEGRSGTPLIVVIDELDRCRPDYALSMLEVVKHFFSVPGVHFVLGVNLDALGHMVRVRYGTAIDAQSYLRKFITLTMKLQQTVDEEGRIFAPIRYFETSAKKMGIAKRLIDDVSTQLKCCIESASISLRDVEKILTQLALLPQRSNLSDLDWGWRVIIVSLAIFRATQPSFFDRAIRRKINISEIDDFFGFQAKMVDPKEKSTGFYVHEAFVIRSCWMFVLTGSEPEGQEGAIARGFLDYTGQAYTSILRGIERDFFRLFQVNDQI